MTRAELAFSALDRDNSGYISAKEMRKLSAKLSEEELNALMVKLDSDGDGVLSFEEFKVLFDKNEKRKESKIAAQNKAIENVNNELSEAAAASSQGRNECRKSGKKN